MSVALPKGSAVFGAVTPDIADIKEIKVHLGATKEVSSYSVILWNFDQKYTVINPINLGVTTTIYLGREPSAPRVLTGIVEDIDCQAQATTNTIVIAGRCNGEKCFRKTITRTYVNTKGHVIIKDLLDNYLGLGHTRGVDELVEDCDTTYTLLEYEDTPAWDIIKYISETADLSGIIGYEFRVAGDGNVEWFPKGSKAAPFLLNENFAVASYSKSVSRKRDKIKVLGAALQKLPTDESWTEKLDINDDGTNDWISGTGTGTVALSSSIKQKGTYSIRHTTNTPDYYAQLRLNIPASLRPNTNKFPNFNFLIRRGDGFSGQCVIYLQDAFGATVYQDFQLEENKWMRKKFLAGFRNRDNWNGGPDVIDNFAWNSIAAIIWELWFPGGQPLPSGTGSFWVDDLYFNGKRFEATYGAGTREYTETDDELYSDEECMLRAKALYANLNGPQEHIVLESEIIDYGSYPMRAGDLAHCHLPNENVDGDYRVIFVEMAFDSEAQTLKLTLELGYEPPLLADYIYGLRPYTVTVEKLARLKGGPYAATFVTGSLGRIGSDQLEDLSVLTAKIKDLAVESAKIANLAVTNAKIANLAVDNAKIADATITDLKILNGTLTFIKVDQVFPRMSYYADNRFVLTAESLFGYDTSHCAGSGQVTASANYVKLECGASAGSQADMRTLALNLNATFQPHWKCRVRWNTLGRYLGGYIGFMRDDTHIICFRFMSDFDPPYDQWLWAVGGTGPATRLLKYEANRYYVLEIRYISPTQVEFWVDGAKLATVPGITGDFRTFWALIANGNDAVNYTLEVFYQSATENWQ
jgi:hypothetical protein